MNVKFRKNFIKVLSLVNILGLFVQINYGMEPKEHIGRSGSFNYCKNEIHTGINSLPSIERNIKIQTADGTLPHRGIPGQALNLPLASLISTRSAGAVEGDYQKEAPFNLSSKNNYHKILQEIEELTARIHAEVDRVLANYRRDTAEYHRRMGAMGKEGLSTMIPEIQEQEIEEGQLKQYRIEAEKTNKKIPRQEKKHKVKEIFLKELASEGGIQIEQHRVKVEETKEETPRQEEQHEVEESLNLKEQFKIEDQQQPEQNKTEEEQAKSQMHLKEEQQKAQETLKPEGQLKPETQNQVEQRRIDGEQTKAQMHVQEQHKAEEILKTERNRRRRANQSANAGARRAI